MRTSPRTKSPNLWDNSPANTSLNVPNSSTHWRNPPAGRLADVHNPPPGGGKHPVRIKKGTFRESPKGLDQKVRR